MYRTAFKGAVIGAAGAGVLSATIPSQSWRNAVNSLSTSRAYCSTYDKTTLFNAHKQKLQSVNNGECVHQETDNRVVSTIPTANGQSAEIKGPVKRDEQLRRLESDEFDVLIIGGGVVGAATAVEATSRGLTVALVDKGDFASGTSSKSTKLIHGGVRYLEQAFTQLDPSMIHLVREALHERTHMLDSCSYMNKPLPILIPLSTWWEIPYMWVGVKLYEFIAGSSSGVPKSYFLSRADTVAKFPELDADRLDLKGSIVYFDGQMNDARHTMALALTAADSGAVALNYVKVDSLTHTQLPSGAKHVSGATATDVLSGRQLPIRAKTVVNAAGPFADQLRAMDDPAAPPLIVPAAGAHLSLPAHICPADMGLLVPKTPDGRLLFFLPWERGTIAGTTDSKSDIVDLPVPQASEVDFILDVMNHYLKTPLGHGDIRSVWAGLRPLVKDPKVEGTAKLSRNHVVLTSEGGLVSVMGGKYTTHRQMAEDAMEALLADARTHGIALQAPEHQAALARSVSFGKPIHGAADADSVFGGDFAGARVLLEEVYGLDRERGDYLVRNYGTRAVQVALLAAERARKLKVAVSVALEDAEVEYAVDWENALRAEDVLVRRTRLGFVHTQGARDSAERVVRIMGDKLGWDATKRSQEKERALYVLSHMDYESIKAMQKK